MVEVELVDAHCHLDEVERRGLGVEEALALAHAAGVNQVVSSGDSLDDSRRAMAIAERHGEVFFTAGWHPSNGRAPRQDELADLRTLLSHPRAVALGEVGLDYSHRWGPPAAEPASQRRILAQMLELAAEVRLPVVIHLREAQADLLQVLDRGPAVHAMLHCFSGGPEFAAEAVARGLLCSFAGNVTFSSASDLHAAVRVVPAGSLLVETDAPFLAPEPRRGRLCHPAMVRLTAQWIAARRGECLNTLAAATTAATREFFRLPAVARA